MKKFFILAALVSLGALSACSSTQSINDRIQKLQTAINAHDYAGYMACFDDSASMQSSYISSKFDTDYPTGKTYSFGTAIVVGTTATCTSTKSTTGSTTYNNVFEMVESGSDWYISKWTEDSTVIFFVKQPLNQQ